MLSHVTPFEISQAIGGVLSAFGAGGVLSAWLPKAEPGTVWAFVRNVIDLIGQNYRNAKNCQK
jgi:hypothetical protein